MSKKKLFVWCDFIVPTGFGNVAKNLLEDMYKYYDVSILGINYLGDTKYDTSKYFVYPTDKYDLLGFKKLPMLISREKPDLIFLFQDIFHISEFLPAIKKAAPEAKIVSYFPIDGAPVSLAWGNVLKECDAVVTYSDWAIRVIKDRFPDLDNPIHKLYHGVDTKTFFPLTKNDTLMVREKLQWANKFTVININRYQPRKFIPGSLRAFSMFAKGYKVCKCGNKFPIYHNRCDLNMCPKEDIVDTVDERKNDVMLYLHMLPQEASMGPGRANLLQNHVINAGFEDKDMGKIISLNGSKIYNGEVSESRLNEIYNAANINISVSLGEGCGLSLLESAATGTSSIAPRNSAIPEQLRGTGHLINNTTLMNQALDNAHLRPVVDMWKMKEALEIEYKKWKENANGGKIIDTACINNIQTNFLWDDKRGKLREVFRNVLK